MGAPREDGLCPYCLHFEDHLHNPHLLFNVTRLQVRPATLASMGSALCVLLETPCLLLIVASTFGYFLHTPV